VQALASAGPLCDARGLPFGGRGVKEKQDTKTLVLYLASGAFLMPPRRPKRANIALYKLDERYPRLRCRSVDNSNLSKLTISFGLLVRLASRKQGEQAWWQYFVVKAPVSEHVVNQKSSNHCQPEVAPTMPTPERNLDAVKAIVKKDAVFFNSLSPADQLHQTKVWAELINGAFCQ
jgi:hypothetical protein